jgi:uncharacterized protein (TIGR00369 family)
MGSEQMLGDQPPCDVTMGFCVEELREGYSRWTWTIRDARFDNPIGRVLGGFIAVFADELMGSCMVSTLKEGESFTTAELKINFMRPVFKETLTGEGFVTKRGRNIAFLEAKIVNGEGKLVSTSTSTVVIFPSEEGAQRPPQA